MGLYGFIILANSDPFFIPCFLKAFSIFSSVASDSSLLLTMPLGVFDFACGQARLLRLWNFSLFSRFSACFLVSTSTSRFPVRNFFIFLGLKLLDIIFSIRKGDIWSNFISCSDSIMMNLGKSLSVSESESVKYLLDFLKEAMIVVYFPLVLCSTTHHRVQLALGISQWGKPFCLAEMGIHYQYTHIKGKILSLCKFLGFILYNLTVVSTLLSSQLTLCLTFLHL